MQPEVLDKFIDIVQYPISNILYQGSAPHKKTRKNTRSKYITKNWRILKSTLKRWKNTDNHQQNPVIKSKLEKSIIKTVFKSRKSNRYQAKNKKVSDSQLELTSDYDSSIQKVIPDEDLSVGGIRNWMNNWVQKLGSYGVKFQY